VRTNFGSKSGESKIDSRHDRSHQLVRDGGHLLRVSLGSEGNHGIEFDAKHRELQQFRRQQRRNHFSAENADINSFDGVSRVV